MTRIIAQKHEVNQPYSDYEQLLFDHTLRNIQTHNGQTSLTKTTLFILGTSLKQRGRCSQPLSRNCEKANSSSVHNNVWKAGALANTEKTDSEVERRNCLKTSDLANALVHYWSIFAKVTRHESIWVNEDYKQVAENWPALELTTKTSVHSPNEYHSRKFGLKFKSKIRNRRK